MSISKCKAIVLGTVNYSESSVVLKCYTDLFGLQSYMINGVRSKKGNIRPSQLQPLTLLELEAYHQQNKNLQRIKELKCAPILQHLHFDVVKSAVGIFVAETLGRCIREENHTDEKLFTFLFNAIQILDLQKETVANFPVYFLSQLTRYLGFLPKGKFSSDTNGFDIKEGAFISYDNRNPFQMDTIASEHFSLLLHYSFDIHTQLNITHRERITLLEWIMSYYNEHIASFNELKSNKILREVLG